MAIGQVKFTGTPGQYSSPRVSSEAFGSGVGTALKGLANSLDDHALSLEAIQTAERERKQRNQGFDAETSWARLQGKWAREQQDRVQQAEINGEGLTEARVAEIEADRQAFLAGLPEHLRGRYEGTTAVAVENIATSTYTSEYALRNNYEIEEVGNTVNELALDIAAGNSDQESALGIIDRQLSLSGLPEAQKALIREKAAADLAAAEFHKVLVDAQAGKAPVGPADGKNPVAPGLTPAQVGLLNAIAARESAGDYGVRFGGDGNSPGHFTDFSKHPGIFERTANGQLSSAAGRYQLTKTTWDRVAGILGLTDFSPVSQDRAALYLAEEQYNRQVGPGERTFQEVLAGGDRQEIMRLRKALVGTWKGLAHMSDDAFANVFMGAKGLRGGGTGSAAMPDVWNDPRFAAIPYGQRAALAASASDVARGMQKAVDDQKVAMADMLRASLAAGDPNAQASIIAAIQGNQVPLSQVDDLLNLGKKDREEAMAGARFGEAARAGTILANDKESQNASDRFLRDSGIMEGVQNLDATAGYQLANSVVSTGVMSPGVSGMLEGMANSANAKQAVYAMGVVSSMRAKGRNAFELAAPESLVEMANAWDVISRHSPVDDPQAVWQKFNDWRSPEQRQMRELASEEAREILKTISPGDVLEGFRTWGNTFGLVTEPELPVSPQATAELHRDFTQLYSMYYPLFQDDEQTREFVTEQLQYNWAPTDVGGRNTLTYLSPNAPAAGYPSIGGSRSWIREDILEAEGWDREQQFELLTDAQSAADVRRGEPASYLINRQDEFGNYAMVTEEDGITLKRFRPTISPELRAGIEARQTVTNLRAQEAKQAELVEQLDNLLTNEILLRRGKEGAAVLEAPEIRAQEERLDAERGKLQELQGSIEELRPQAESLGRSAHTIQEELREVEQEIGAQLSGAGGQFGVASGQLNLKLLRRKQELEAELAARGRN